MCGIAGAVGPTDFRDFVSSANTLQHHRGPDAQDSQNFEFGQLNVSLAHQRLAIFDLSDAGKQPMISASGRFAISYNGEIYNFPELIEKYGLNNLRSRCDTEVMLELIEQLGIDEALKQFQGMWAFVALDRENGKLYFSRDRIGKKPLYTRKIGNALYFASELKTLLNIPGHPRPTQVNQRVAKDFLAYALQNTTNESWIEGITAFPPASVGEVDFKTSNLELRKIRRYWTPQTDTIPLDGSPQARIEALRTTVDDAIVERLRADVPVGIALSGGLDSSIIAATAKRVADEAGGRDVVLFSAVNPGKKEDESYFIDLMANHLGLKVNKFALDSNEDEGLESLLLRGLSGQDGPITSFSSLLFLRLMEKAADLGITVVLTGQGADEGYCGYLKYPALQFKRLLKAGNIVAATKLMSGFVRRGTFLPQFRLTEAKRYLGAANNSILGEALLDMENTSNIAAAGTSLAARQRLDIERFSVPFLCHYEDRMSMQASREVRSPFLDYRVVNAGLQLPDDLKLNDGWTKYALRKAYEADLPQEITWRKDKKGFVNPQDDWLKTTLKATVLDVMENPNAPIYSQGLVNRVEYLKLFKRYCDGNKGIWFRDVFAPFSLALWLDTQVFNQTAGS